MLVALDKNGNRVELGDTVTSFRGNTYTLRGWSAPRGASTGRLYVVSDPDSEGIGHGYYPEVFGVKLVII